MVTSVASTLQPVAKRRAFDSPAAHRVRFNIGKALVSVVAATAASTTRCVKPRALTDSPQSGPRGLAFQILRNFDRGEVVQPNVVVFMCGLPGAGKSTVIDRRYRGGWLRRRSTAVLDLDTEMAQHPAYDPSDPDKVYRGRHAYNWADKRVENRFLEALQDKSLARIVIDGTGTNCERQVRRMRAAREAGWFVKVLHVHIPPQTAVRRASKRSRPVAAPKIYAYQAKIAQSLVAMAAEADELETFDAPAHDPPHVLRREGYVDKSRTIVAAEAEAQREAQRREVTERVRAS